MHNMEHRWGSRVRVRRRIQLRCAGCAPASAILLDVSLSGGLVQTNVAADLLSGIEVEIEISDEIRMVPARVVRRELTSLALEWSEFAPGAVIALIGEYSHTCRRSSVGSGVVVRGDG